MRRARVLAGLLVAVTAACGGSGRPLALRQRPQLAITSPAELARQQLPVHLRWADANSQPSLYAVFIDTAPVPPGVSLSTRADAGCDPDSTCRASLNRRHIFVVAEPSLTIATLPADSQGVGRADHAHDASIVRITANGFRADDQVVSVRFFATA